jgi:hypothetical protein
VPLTSKTPRTERPMPRSRGGGMGSLKNTNAGTAAGTSAEMRATPVRPKSSKLGSKASRMRKPRR